MNFCFVSSKDQLKCVELPFYIPMLCQKYNADFVKNGCFGAKRSEIRHTKTGLDPKLQNFMKWILFCVIKEPSKNVWNYHFEIPCFAGKNADFGKKNACFGAKWGCQKVINCLNLKKKSMKFSNSNFTVSPFYGHFNLFGLCRKELLGPLKGCPAQANFYNLTCIPKCPKNFQLIVFSQSLHNKSQSWAETDRVTKYWHHIRRYVKFFLV